MVLICLPQMASSEGCHSLILQGLVNHRGRLMNTNMGNTGKVHDAGCWDQVLFERRSRAFIPQKQYCYNGVSVPTVSLEDPTYSLLPWLMKPYFDIMNPGKREFNFKLSSCWMVVMCMFGRIKTWWHCLQIHQVASVANAVCITVSCSTLHNTCEDEYFHPKWAQDNSNLQAVYR